MAQDVSVRSDHPDEYIVVKGDTLWDISAQFLDHPWQWPAIWHANQQIEKIRIQAQKPDGTVFEEEADGLHAVCLQHEMDHLLGKLFVDYLSPLKRQMVRKKLEKQRRQAVQVTTPGVAL